MEDKRLDKRKEFFDPVKDGRIEREKYMVDLRKKRKQEMFKNKRMRRMHEESKAGGDEWITTEDGRSIPAKSADYPLKKYEHILKDVVPIIYKTDAQLVSRTQNHLWIFLQQQQFTIKHKKGLDYL